jgi:hypothetical protein
VYFLDTLRDSLSVAIAYAIRRWMASFQYHLQGTPHNIPMYCSKVSGMTFRTVEHTLNLYKVRIPSLDSSHENAHYQAKRKLEAFTINITGTLHHLKMRTFQFLVACLFAKAICSHTGFTTSVVSATPDVVSVEPTAVSLTKGLPAVVEGRDDQNVTLFACTDASISKRSFMPGFDRIGVWYASMTCFCSCPVLPRLCRCV